MSSWSRWNRGTGCGGATNISSPSFCWPTPSAACCSPSRLPTRSTRRWPAAHLDAAAVFGEDQVSKGFPTSNCGSTNRPSGYRVASTTGWMRGWPDRSRTPPPEPGSTHPCCGSTIPLAPRCWRPPVFPLFMTSPTTGWPRTVRRRHTRGWCAMNDCSSRAVRRSSSAHPTCGRRRGPPEPSP